MLVCKIFLFITPSEIVAIRVKWWFYNGVTNGTNKKISLLLALCCLLIFCAEISRKHKNTFIEFCTNPSSWFSVTIADSTAIPKIYNGHL